MKKVALSIMMVSLIVLIITMLATGEKAKESIANEPLVNNWEIDKELKFHYAYLPKKGIFREEDISLEYPGIPDFGKPGIPDITNINYENIIGLGFPLLKIKNPENYKFYLKFYDYPEVLDPVISAERIVSPYLLYRMESVYPLYSFIKNRNNLYVKLGHTAPADEKFSKENPYPDFAVPKGPVKTEMAMVTPQALFDSSIPFSSLYITTKGNIPSDLSEAEQAAWTTKGLMGFHQELLEIYKKNFIEVKGTEPEKYHYFMELCYQVQHKDEAPVVTIYKFPKKPMTFTNYNDLPMPQDPKRIFLSGLLIIHRNRYARALTKRPVTEIIVDSKEFKRDYLELNGDLLEVASIYKKYKISKGTLLPMGKR